ncbi:EF-Hand 1 [Vigna unguiculata]|uniref:EF-Hand 1 n=1 Tax=Vigna unguiculata TaxID=3917 RepID=A0A4D6MC54_VIGUN|nr:EF-Hand 1 [Vigna unguiculata]
MKKIMNLLKETDTNRDGRYNKDELKQDLKDLGAFFPRAFDQVDVNNDGQINDEEIDSLLEYLCSCGFGK